MKRIKSLPRRGEWEIDHLPRSSSDEPGRMMVVYDRSEGATRAMDWVKGDGELRALLENAACNPLHDVPPSRPKVVWCRQLDAEALAGPVRSLGAQLAVDDDLSIVADLTAALTEALGIDVDDADSDLGAVPAMGALWRPRLRDAEIRVMGATLGDGIVYRIAEGLPGLQNCVVLVQFWEAVPLAIALYRSEEAYQIALEGADAGSTLPNADSLWIYFADLDSLSDERADELQEEGLATQDAGLLLFAIDDEDPRAVSGSEETALLSLWMCLVEGWKNHHDCITGVPGAWTTKTLAGPVCVHSERDDGTPLLAGVDHSAELVESSDSESVPRLIVKLGSADAVALAEAVDLMDAIEFVPRGVATEIRAWGGGRSLGLLTRLDAEEIALRDWTQRGVGEVAIAGGGTSGPVPGEGGWVANIRVYLLNGRFSLDWEGDDEPYRESDYEGPTSSWPKASEVLLAFADPLLMQETQPDQRKQILSVAGAVFSAVSIADHGHDTSVLEQVRQMGQSSPDVQKLNEALVLRKRAQFGHDPRVFSVVEHKTDGLGGDVLSVEWSDVSR